MDGTSEFIEHCGEFAVMIGLALDGAPVLGVVYHPVKEKLYCAAYGTGAILKEHGVVTSLRVSKWPPIEVVRDLLAFPNIDLPVVDRIVSVPVFAPDGTIQVEAR